MGTLNSATLTKNVFVKLKNII